MPVLADCDAGRVGWLRDGRSGSLTEPEGRRGIQRNHTVRLKDAAMMAEQ